MHGSKNVKGMSKSKVGVYDLFFVCTNCAYFKGDYLNRHLIE